MFQVSTNPTIKSTQNCNYSLRYCAATSLQRGQASLTTLKGGSYTKNVASTGGCSCPTRCNTKQSIYYSASSLYMFPVSTTSIIRSTQNCNYSLRYCAANSLQRDHVWPRWREVATQKIWPVPEAVITVLCTPDDGCFWHPKHVEWTCRIINRLLCVESRWTIINVDPNICFNTYSFTEGWRNSYT